MDVKGRIREFILEELTNTGCDEDVRDDESLIHSRILDSLSILQLISFLDEEFGILLEDDELDPDKIDTIEHITKFVETKLASNVP